MECSSFFDSGGDFFAFLGRSLEAIEHETPAAHRAMCLALGARTLAIEADGCAMGLEVRHGRLVLTDDGQCSDVFVRVHRNALLRLIEGECSIVDAALCGDLFLRGRAEDLAAFGDALTAFVQGAVRSVTAPSLLQAYRAQRDAGQGRTSTAAIGQTAGIHDE